MKRWTGEDEMILVREWGSRSIEEIALLLGRSRLSVEFKATRMGIWPKSDRAAMSWWTEEEMEALRREWPVLSTDEIARTLGRSRKAVESKAASIGLRRRVESIRPVVLPTPMRVEAQEPRASEATVPGVVDWLREWRAIRRRQRARSELIPYPEEMNDARTIPRGPVEDPVDVVAQGDE